MRPDPLPLPDDDARAASQALDARLRERIATAGGWLRFDAWMDGALYTPGLGYYSGGAQKFGRDGDFVTAPQMSPLFGACVARQCVGWLQDAGAEITEFGAGGGELAASLLETLPALGVSGVRYRIVEVSGELRARQRETLRRRVPQALSQVEWLDAWPATLRGVVLGNELLDALPVRLFAFEDDRVRERGVVTDPVSGGLRLEDREADAAFAAEVLETLAASREQWVGEWPARFESELGEAAFAWVREAAGRLVHGALLLIDYGFPELEFYHPHRQEGTLMCHYRHRAHPDPFWWPGLQDITAHVDFTAVARAGLDAGLDLLGYTTQSHFLINAGLPALLASPQALTPAAQLQQSQIVNLLTSEAEMGELFKVIALGRGLAQAGPGFAQGDRRHRL